MKMEVDNKPVCKFGIKCYRKNPKHFDTYSHPGGSNVKESGTIKNESKVMFETSPKRNTNRSVKGRMRQTKLTENDLTSGMKSSESKFDGVIKKRVSHENTKAVKRRKTDSLSGSKKSEVENTTGKSSNICSKLDNEDTSVEIRGDCDTLSSSSLTPVKNDLDEAKKFSEGVDVRNKTVEEIIKMLFLVDMPPDFYSFYEFSKSVEESHPLHLAGLKLVGPFNVLTGEMNYSIEQDLFLCHWRYYYDPPEFQTVLVTDSGFHIGYWRDDPKENPVFLASNNPNKNCIFKMEAENIFGSVFHYLNDFIKTTDPFKKVKITKLQTDLSNWAKKNKFSLVKKTGKMEERQKKVVAKTFHTAGIVVPVEAKTDLGYRPLIETDENLKRICQLIMKASDDSEREGLWDNLQPLITAANIANDECDFGNGLELGIDLFCMGSAVFHETIEHLLSTAYSLLNRNEFEKIIRAHLKHRRKGNSLSVCNSSTK